MAAWPCHRPGEEKENKEPGPESRNVESKLAEGNLTENAETYMLALCGR